MTSAEVLVEAFGRIRDVVEAAVGGLTPEQLSARPDGRGNSVAWLVWHLTRVQDDHVADAFGTEQIWTSAGWYDRFALPLDPAETGYRHTTDEVAVLRVSSGELLTGYHRAVHERTVTLVGPLRDGDLGRVVDVRWDPPVTLAVRLVSVIADDLQHAGQAAYVRGLLTEPTAR
ncbi:MAG: mycothiol transferase [Cellulomonas sp.]